MVVSLGPGKFYGKSLPRPRIYTNVEYNDHRVDPPLPVFHSLMSWAEEAHWSMGGLSDKRIRLQGKIEGNVEKLRIQLDNLSKTQARSPQLLPGSDLGRSKRVASPYPPPAPVASKRRRFMALIEEEEEKDEEEKEGEEFKVARRSVRRGRLVKKLGDDFDRVASSEMNVESDSMALRTRSRRLVKGGGGDAVKEVVEEAEKTNPKENKTKKSEAEKSPVSLYSGRTSPRLVKGGGGDAVKEVVEEAEKSIPEENKTKKSEAEKSPVSLNRVRTSPRFAKSGSN